MHERSLEDRIESMERAMEHMMSAVQAIANFMREVDIRLCVEESSTADLEREDAYLN